MILTLSFPLQKSYSTPQRDEGVTTDTKVSGQREQRHKADEINEHKMKKK